MSVEELKNQYIKTFEKDESYIHRDDLDGLILVIKDILERLTALEAK